MSDVRIINPCPGCGEKLTYDKGFAGTYWEPPEPEQLLCEYCGWDAEDEIGNYVLTKEDMY